MSKTIILQGTPEWFMARRGLGTGSAWKNAMGEKEWTDTAMSYAYQLAAERLGGEDEHLETPAMERGNINEGPALDEYEETLFRTVERRTFHIHDTLNLACSPDGELVDAGRRGIVEVKCMKSAKHLAVVHNKAVPKEHIVQVMFNLWITGADFCDFVSYHPSMRDDLRLCVVRVERHDAFISAMSLRAVKFLAMVDDMVRQRGGVEWQPYHRLYPELTFGAR